MANGVLERSVSGAVRPEPRTWARDAQGAVLLVEGRIAQRLFVALGEGRAAAQGPNVFGDDVAIDSALEARTSELVARAQTAAASGARVAVVASAAGLASARAEMRAIADARIGIVAHAFCDTCACGSADAWALCDLGWGVLFASSVAESLDLALVARRAAEDCGTPFVVVHERSRARHTEAIAPPSKELCEAFVGTPRPRAPHEASVSARAFAERVPFALGSAMRELEALTGRHHDVLERVPARDTQLALVGLGPVGDSLIAECDRLRAAGRDVGAIKIVALRPFPGPRLVKALSRALVVSVLEDADEPLAAANPLTREIKSAFADALTWHPEYPGVGRIPRILSGIAGAAGHELDARDVDAVVRNMIAGDERGKRTFVLGADALPSHADVSGAAELERPSARAEAARPFSMRGIVADEPVARACADVCVAVIASALGLRARASVRAVAAAEGGGWAFDVSAGRERPRGTHAPYGVGCVALDDAAIAARANPFARLAERGVLVVPTSARSADALWSEIPAYVKAIAFDHEARLVGWAPPPSSEEPWVRAGAFAGLALAVARGASAAPLVDASLVARETEDAVRTAFAHGGAPASARDEVAARAAAAARAAFESSLEVPRATVERDEEGVRLGRKDARASGAPASPDGSG